MPENEKVIAEAAYKTAFNDGRDACITRVGELERHASDAEYRTLGYIISELAKVEIQ